MVLVVGSMTGVLEIPYSGTTSPQETSPLGTVFSPAPISETCHNGFPLAPALLSASNAYTLSCCVATNTTLCVLPACTVPVPRVTPATYSGCAYTHPSTG